MHGRAWALAQSMLRRLVRAEHAEHAGCDGSLGNLTGCIEVLLLPVVLLLLLLLLLLLPLLLRVRRAVCGATYCPVNASRLFNK